MSGDANPKGNPVNPPMPNIGKKDNANNIAVSNSSAGKLLPLLFKKTGLMLFFRRFITKFK